MVTFSWFFNNSDHKDELDEERFTTDGKVSTLNFTPTNNQDYGTLYCEGENVIGHQMEPCTFQIVPTGRLMSNMAFIKLGIKIFSKSYDSLVMIQMPVSLFSL